MEIQITATGIDESFNITFADDVRAYGVHRAFAEMMTHVHYRGQTQLWENGHLTTPLGTWQVHFRSMEGYARFMFRINGSLSKDVLVRVHYRTTAVAELIALIRERLE